MREQGLVNKLTNKCIDIIKNNNPDDSLDKISNLRIPGTSDNLGYSTALKIYEHYSNDSVPYSSEEYKNNINEYKDKVNRNIKKARNYAKNKK
jgi:hypothetical protein